MYKNTHIKTHSKHPSKTQQPNSGERGDDSEDVGGIQRGKETATRLLHGWRINNGVNYFVAEGQTTQI